MADGSSTTARARTSARTVPDLSIWQSYGRVGGGLTPSQLSQAIASADGGTPRQLIDISNAARQKDCHLQSVLGKREKAVASAEFELALPGSKTRGRQLTFAASVHEAIQPKLPALIEHLAGAVFFGFAVSEIVWGRQGTKIVPVDFIHHSPRRFEFDQTTRKLVWRDDSMSVGVDFRAKWPGRFIVSQPRVNGDVPHREGLNRPLLWAWLFRNWTTADWAKLAELAWKPWRVGKYQKAASQEDIDDLTSIIDAMSSSGIAVLPETTELKFEWPTGGGASKQGSHAEFIAAMAAEMSKAVLGGTLTTEAGDKGARALGTVHETAEASLVLADARHVAAVLSSDLFVPMTRINFGDKPPPPMLKVSGDDDEDLVAFATSVEKLVGPTVGMKIGEKWARERIGVPDLQAGEKPLGPTEAEPADGKPSDGTAPDPQDDVEEPDTGEEDA